MLNTDIQINGSDVKIVLEGRLDANTSPGLKEEMGKLPESVKNIELDVQKVSYTSSAGLRVILQYHNQLNQRGGKLTVSHPNETLMEVFEDTGLLDCLNIQE